MNSFKIGGRQVGPGHPILIVGEVGQAHDGSLGAAHAYIDAAAEAGCDAVKFQTHIADAESTPGEPWRVQFSTQDATRFDYWKRMEFTPAQWRELSDHAAKRNLLFLSSAFSSAAIDLLNDLGVPAWKFGAGEITSLPLLDQAAQTGRPVLLSSGMSSWGELEEAVQTVQAAGAPVGVFQCTTAYPCPSDQVGLNVLAEIRDRFQVPVGLSDHSGEVFAGLGAAALGADMIEVHMTLSKAAFGPDVPASLDPEQLAQLCRGVRELRTMIQHPVDKDVKAQELGGMKALFQKSVVAARDLTAGQQITDCDLTLKKPGDGLAPKRLQDLIGRTLKTDVSKDTLLKEEHIE